MPEKQGLDSNKKGNFARASCFLYISLPSLHDFNVKLANFTHYGKRWHNRTVSAVLFQIEIEIEPLTIQFQKNSPTFDKLNEVEFDRIAGSDEVCHSANSLFKKRFRCPRRRCCLIYPQIQRQDDHCSQDFDCDCLFSKQWLPSHFLWNWKTHNI